MQKKDLIYPALVFLIWRLIILTFQFFIQPTYISTSESLTLTQRLLTSWVLYWDGGHYLSIASSGYEFPKQAFFPLWPLLIKLTAIMGSSPVWGSYFLTLILSFLNFSLFYLLAIKLVGYTKAKWALILFSCYPAVIFLHAGYSENLFLFFALLSYLLLENKKYHLSAVAAGLGSASRIAGIAITLSFWFMRIPLRRRILMFGVGILGIAGYMVYSYISFGDFLYFIKAQQAWCETAGRCSFTFPLAPLFQYALLLLFGIAKIGLSSGFIDWFSSIVFLGLLVQIWKKLPRYYFIYSLIILMLPLLTGTTTSMVRFTLVSFPSFFVLPYILKNKIVLIIIILLFLMLELRFVALFTNRVWVA